VAVPPATGGVRRSWGRHIGSLVRSAVLIGPVNSARAIAYALHRSRLDARAARIERKAQRTVRQPGRLVQAEPVPGGGRFAFTGATLEVRFLAGPIDRDGGIFVGWNGAEPHPSYALADDQPPAWATDTQVERMASSSWPDEGWAVRCGDTAVRMDPYGRLDFEHAGRVFRTDDAPEWRGEAWTLRTGVPADAMVLGLGGRAGALDRRPGRYRLWNTDPGGSYIRGDDPLSMCLPVSLVVADDGCHLAFHDVTFDGVVRLDAAETPSGPASRELVSKDPGRPEPDRGGPDSRATITMDLTGGPLRYYVFPGDPADALERYTALTGRPALLPRWALGFHQSRWEYGSEAAMRTVVDEFARHDLPLSALWLDIDHLVRRRVFTIDKARYPDLGGFAARLAKDDIHLVAIVDPAVPRRRDFRLHRDGLAQDVFCRDVRGRVAKGVMWPGATSYPDFTSPRTRQWWGEQHAEYLRLGIDGFWNDMNEPSVFAAFGDPSLPKSTRADLDGRGGDHREAHNLYGLLMSRATYEAVRRQRPDRRPFVLTRAGWAGVQRYAGTWTGDIASSWDNLAISLSFTLSLGACGVPYSGPDIGGFHGHPNAELFVRWFELAAYLPFFRTHSAKATPPREPWAYGQDVLELLRGLLNERYALLPYWYTLAWDVHRTGRPFVRPLAFDYPDDRRLRAIDDEFLLGDAFLVAPVLVRGARERPVVLPPGRWYDRRTGEAYDSPDGAPLEIVVDAPLGRIPVFVRAGSVVPTEDRAVDGTTRLVLEAYRPDPAGGAVPRRGSPGGRLVTDSGDGFAEPVEECFEVVVDGATDQAFVRYVDGPARELPYPVRWPAESPAR